MMLIVVNYICLIIMDELETRRPFHHLALMRRALGHLDRLHFHGEVYTCHGLELLACASGFSLAML